MQMGTCSSMPWRGPHSADSCMCPTFPRLSLWLGGSGSAQSASIASVEELHAGTFFPIIVNYVGFFSFP